jgi:hypothetical protein
LSEKATKTLIAAVLVAVVLFSVFVFILSLGEGGLLSGPKVYRYSDTPTVKPSKLEIEVLLNSLGQTMSPNDLSLLYEKLARVPQVDSTNDTIGDYTRTLFDLSGNLSLIESQLRAANSSLASGHRSEADALVRQLEQHSEQSATLLQSSYSLLNQIGEQYQIDTATQREKLHTLDQLYNNYSAQIDQLASELTIQTSLAQTILDLNSSARAAFVGENVLVYGSLRTVNDTVLADRNVTITWGYSTALLKSDFNGNFEGNVSFPLGFPAGLVIIEAVFNPSGQDKLLYEGATAQIQIQVAYRPSAIAAQIHPTNVKPLDIVDIWGNLTTLNRKPLEKRTIIMTLDGTSLGNATTDKSGFFYFYFHVPRAISNGTHVVEITFNAANDRFAPSNTTLAFNIEILETQTQIQVDRSTVLSGMNLVINGTISYVNATYNNQASPSSGNVTIYIDDVPYTNTTIGSQGSFVSSIQIPVGIGFGSHLIAVQYNSDRPWIQNSQGTIRVFVLSSPVIVLLVALIAIVSYLGTYVVARNRRGALQRRALLVQPTTQLQRPLLVESSHRNLLAAIEAETDNVSRAKTVYRLAQLMISKKLSVESRDTETPSEYLARVVKTAPSLNDSLAHIVELFELAEYSPYPIEADQIKEAKDRILELREELENVRTGEDYKD